MKKNILLVLIGLVFGVAGTVIASNYLASDVVYNDTTVENALNELYDRSNASVYTGSLNITPTENEQTISSNGKRFTSDITIGAIPNTYKNLTSNTTVDATKLLDGVTAYNNLGELVTGNINTNCVYGTFVCTSCTTSTGQKIANFKADNILIYNKNSSNWFMYYYNKAYNSNEFQVMSSSIASKYISFDNKFKYNSNNELYIHDLSTDWSNKTLYYMICK